MGTVLIWAPFTTLLVYPLFIWLQLEPLHKGAHIDLAIWVGAGSERGASVAYFVRLFLKVFCCGFRFNITA
jgi:hypothetical protein